MIDKDAEFFLLHPDRHARIRFPDPYNELHREFHELGDHPSHRRRILLWRVPPDNPYYDPQRRPLLKIPFLAFSSETIEDNDNTLLPIIKTIMMEQLLVQGGRQ